MNTAKLNHGSRNKVFKKLANELPNVVVDFRVKHLIGQEGPEMQMSPYVLGLDFHDMGMVFD